MRSAAIPWPATPLTPSLSSEHLSNTVYHSWIPSTFLFLHVMPHKPAKPFDCTLPAFNTSCATLVDVSCVRYVSKTSLICLLIVAMFMLHHIQGSNSSLWHRAKTSVICTTMHMVSSLLCLNALNLASAWCLEHDFVRLRKVSRDWYRAFEYVPDEVVQMRIESQHSTYFAQMVALQWVRRWTQQEC